MLVPQDPRLSREKLLEKYEATKRKLTVRDKKTCFILQITLSPNLNAMRLPSPSFQNESQ